MKKKIIYLLLLALPLVLITSCEENAVGTPNLNYVSFEANTYNFGVDIDGENTNTILFLLEGDIDLNKVSNLIELMNLPGGNLLQKIKP